MPKGAFPPDQIKNYKLIKEYILHVDMYRLVAPFRYQFLNFVVVCKNDPDHALALYHEPSHRLILKA